MAVWVARGSYGNLRGTGFLNRRNRFFSSRKACLPTVGRPRRTLCGLAALRANYFFSSRKDLPAVGRRRAAKKLCPPLVSCFLLLASAYWLPEAFAPSLLCELFFFFYIFSQRPACGRQAQRNCGTLGLSSGGLGFFAAFPAEIRVRHGRRELTFGKQACQPRLVQIPVSKHKNQGLTLNRGSIVVSA
jgi:hypothetical protein